MITAPLNELNFEKANISQLTFMKICGVFEENPETNNNLERFVKRLSYTCSPELVGEDLKNTLLKAIEYGTKLCNYYVDSKNNDNFKNEINALKKRIESLNEVLKNLPENDVTINFDNLSPVHINYIDTNFDAILFANNRLVWKTNFQRWLNTNFLKHRKKVILQKCLEYCINRYKYYEDNECQHGVDCKQRRVFEDKISILQKLLSSLESNNSEIDSKVVSNIKFAGSKIDLIRILNALYELKKIENSNGQVPPKKEFIEAAGTFFNIELSDYDSSLSQAFKEGTLEANLKIFEDLKDITQKRINS